MRSTEYDEVRRSCEQEGMVLATFETDADVNAIYDVCVAEWAGSNEIINWCFVGFHDQDFDGKYRFVDNDESVDVADNPLWWVEDLGPDAGRLDLCGMVYITGTTPPRVMGDVWCSGSDGPQEYAGKLIPGVCERGNLCKGIYTVYVYISSYHI